MKNEPWTQKFFDLRYQDMFMERTPEQRKHEASIISASTKMTTGMTVADFCCGCGDILSELADRGFQGRGVELCEDYVALARDTYPAACVEQGDALTHDFEQRFDVCYNWFSSFGYLGADADLELIRNMASHTKPGGWILLETYNTYSVLKNFQSRFVYSKSWQGHSYKIVRESRIDLDERRLSQRWSFSRQGERTQDVESFDTSSHLYYPYEISRMLETAGVRDILIGEPPPVGSSSLELLPLSIDSKRGVIVGRLP